MSYTLKTIDELESIHYGAVKLAGAELGIRSFGMQVLDFPAGFSDYPEHDHAKDEQEEVCVVLRGQADFVIDGEEVTISQGEMVKVDAASKRKLQPGQDGVRVLAIGCTPGATYERPEAFRLGAPGMIVAITDRSETPVAEPQVVSGRGEVLWFLGTLARMKLEGRQTAGRFGLWEAVLPHGAAPPLHSHLQDETFYILDGEITAWVVEPELADDGSEPPAWVNTRGRRCGVGDVVFAPGGTPHTFRVESDTGRMLVLSTPAGIEDMVRGLAGPAEWPWLQPPPAGPRVPPERIASVERETGMVRHGPPPPPNEEL